MNSDSGGWFGYLVGPLFLLLAAWFWFGPNLASVPKPGIAQVNKEWLNTEPRRPTIGDPPTIRVNNFDRVCTDCHGLFPLSDKQIENRMQHTHIQLDHGINDSCHNCHDIEDMNRLVLYSGESVSYGDVSKLCQKCHGPTYQDWEVGIHGRVNDYWNEEFGEPRKMQCINCHDPHRPRYPAMQPLAPLPGPNTLRMGRHGEGPVYEHQEADPLRRSLQSAGGHGDHGAQGGEHADPDSEHAEAEDVEHYDPEQGHDGSVQGEEQR